MRQRCELCEALGSAEPARGAKLIGIWVATRDVLLCANHALFALDSDVGSVDELREVYEFVHDDEPVAASAKRARRSGSNDASSVVLAAAAGE